MKNMMKKNRLLYLLAIICIIVLVQLFFSFNKNNNEDAIVSAFTEVDFKNTDSSIEAVVNYGNRYLNEEEKKELLNDIAKKIGLNETYEYSVERNGTGEVSKIYKKAKKATTSIKLASIENEINNNVIELEQYIIINITFNNSVENVITYKEKIDEIFVNMDLKAEITINLIGAYDGNLDINTKDSIVEQLLDAIEANIVTEKRDDSTYNVYAYTNLITKYITVEEKKVNVNIAINYDESNDVTNVMLSSPIINVDY